MSWSTDGHAQWPGGENEPVTYGISRTGSSACRPASRSGMPDRIARLRWCIEHDCRELKTTLGLDRFEGRSFTGEHRHTPASPLTHWGAPPDAPDPHSPPAVQCPQPAARRAGRLLRGGGRRLGQGGGDLRERRRDAAACGWADRCRTGRQAREAPGGLVILVVSPSTRSFLHARRRGCRSSHLSGWKRLIAEISIEKALDEEPIYCAFM